MLDPGSAAIGHGIKKTGIRARGAKEACGEKQGRVLSFPPCAKERTNARMSLPYWIGREHGAGDGRIELGRESQVSRFKSTRDGGGGREKPPRYNKCRGDDQPTMLVYSCKHTEKGFYVHQSSR